MRIFARAVRARAGYPNWRNMKREVERTMEQEVKPEVLDYFTRITDRWKHKVDFSARKRVGTKEITLDVFPTGPNKDLWIWTSGGTRPHPIKPRGTGYPLKFRLGYKPKTWKGYRYRGPGVATGPFRSSYLVMHPGTEAREFEKHIVRFYGPKFVRRMENALRRGARRL